MSASGVGKADKVTVGSLLAMKATGEKSVCFVAWDYQIAQIVDRAGTLFFTDPAYSRRVEKFLKELVWMARVLRHGRENIPAP